MSFSYAQNPNPQLYQIRADVLLDTIARPVWLMSCPPIIKQTNVITSDLPVVPTSTTTTGTTTNTNIPSIPSSNNPPNANGTTVNDTISVASTTSTTNPTDINSIPSSSIATTSTNGPLTSTNTSTTILYNGPTFYHIPDTYLVSLRNDGFDYLYILGVWQTGEIGLQHSQSIYPSVNIQQFVSSPFAVTDYHVADDYGGDNALINLKQRANRIGLRILIDFIPNHIARDHWWLTKYPWLLQQYIPLSPTSLNIEETNNLHHLYFPFKIPSGIQQLSIPKVEPTKIMNNDPNSSVSTSGNGSTTTTIDDSTTTTVYFYYGRDMYNIWKDTVNLNHRHPDTRIALKNTLRWILTGQQPKDSFLSLSSIRSTTNSNSNSTNTSTAMGLADGVRVDMAMLLLNDVITKTWGAIDPNSCLPGPGLLLSSSSTTTTSNIIRPIINEEFWIETLADIKSVCPSSIILGEVYWGYEAKLQSFGFDFTYDKSLLDKLYTLSGDSIMQHIRSSSIYQRKCARFIENHDEKRIAAVHRGGSKGAQAAAVLAFTIQGMHFFHDGQLSGRKLHHSVHFKNRTPELPDIETLAFYKRLLNILKFPEFRNYGCWHQAIITPSRDGNDSWRNIVAYFITPLPGSTNLQTSESQLVQKTINSNSIHEAHTTLSTVHSQSISEGDSPVTITPNNTVTVNSITSTPTSVVSSSSTAPSVPSITNTIQTNNSTGTTSTAESQKIVPEFIPLSITSTNKPEQQSVPINTSTSPALTSTPTIKTLKSLDPEEIIAGRTFVIVVNYSDRSSNGHILFTRADESTYQQQPNLPESINSANYIASLVNGQTGLQSPTGCYLGNITTTTSTTITTPIMNTHNSSISSSSSSTTAVSQRNIGFIDHLSNYSKEYSCSIIAHEGFWINLEPWKAHILEIVQLSEY